ncbi:hypothetical protein ABVS_2808 [Acinetobacter lwoffii]|nr:hypothetical protein ABVS_2808 [Acinetobacter lwoffii]
MVMNTDFKIFHHTNNNAPVLDNIYGTMLDVLDACLVNGFEVGSVSSLTTSGKTVTATFSSSHNLQKYQVIKITGANQSEFNGEHRITEVPNSNQIKFELTTATSTTAASGTIIASLPPLGWEKPFYESNPAGGGKAAYRPANLLLPSRPFLRVVDELDPTYTATYAKYAKVGIVDDMIGINEMSGLQAPYDASNPDKNWVGTGAGQSVVNGWAKWYYARGSTPGISGNQYDYSTPSNGPRKWIVLGDKDYFYIIPSVNPATSGAPNQVIWGFGYFESLYNPDNNSFFLACHDRNIAASTSTSPAIYGGLHASNSGNSSNTGLILFQKYDGTSVYNQGQGKSLNGLSGSFYSGSSDNYLTPYNGNYIFSPVNIFDQVTNTTGLVARGKAPSIHWVFHNKPFSDLSFIEKDGFIYMAKDIATSGSTLGQVMFMLEGVEVD